MNMFQNPYACAVCQESFTIAEALVSHVKTKHKPVKPTEKERDFKDPFVQEFKKETVKAMNQHLNVHKEKKYFCRFCQKAFHYQQVLHRHEMIHTDEQPYGCSFGELKFNQQTSKIVHERTHTGEKTICL